MALTSAELLSLWESGLDRHPIDRALLILARAFPERSPDDLARLSVGQRDELLMQVQRQTFGYQMHSRAYCPACEEGLEFTLDLTTFASAPETDTVRSLTVEDWQLTLRRLTSLDLAAIAPCTSVEAARQQLIQRCLVEAQCGGEAVAAANLPAPVVDRLAQTLSEWDATADVQLALDCPVCDHHWLMGLDMLIFLWGEISARAQRLLQEVDWLARAYGWREADILSLSDRRRHLYVEQVLNR
jgi:hypothetical protein